MTLIGNSTTSPGNKLTVEFIYIIVGCKLALSRTVLISCELIISNLLFIVSIALIFGAIYSIDLICFGSRLFMACVKFGNAYKTTSGSCGSSLRLVVGILKHFYDSFFANSIFQLILFCEVVSVVCGCGFALDLFSSMSSLKQIIL